MIDSKECEVCHGNKWTYDETGRNVPCRCQRLDLARIYLGDLLASRDPSTGASVYRLVKAETCQLLRFFNRRTSYLVESKVSGNFMRHLKTALVHEFGTAIEESRAPLTWKMVSMNEVTDIRFEKQFNLGDKKGMLMLPQLLIITAWIWPPYEHVYREAEILLADRTARGLSTWIVTKDISKLRAIKGVTPEFNFLIKEMEAARVAYIGGSQSSETKSKTVGQNPVTVTKPCGAGPSGLISTPLDFNPVLEPRIPEMERDLVHHDSDGSDSQPAGK